MRLRLPDPEHRYRAVELDSPGLSGPCHYAQGGWQRTLQPRTHRIEYQFRTTARDGTVGAVLDPAEPRTVEGPFGRRSVWEAEDYTPPGWQTAPGTPGRLLDVEVPSALARPLPLQVWAPRGLTRELPAPLLWCHDGDAYAERGSLLQWAGAHIADGSLPPFRLVLARPVRRMQWYSASPRYLRSVDLALRGLRERFAVTAPLAMMGASLGGLTSMLVALRRPDVGAVLSQSGSFFMTGGPDRRWRWFDRVVTAADLIRDGDARPPRRDLLVALTCGRHESNYAANLVTVRALRARGLTVHWRVGADLHNDTAWRDALDPLWPDLLHRCWSKTG